MKAVGTQHIGRRGLFRSNRSVKEGVIQELTPSGSMFRINASEWLENKAETLIELLPDRQIEAPPPAKGGRHQPAFGGDKEPSA